jgi:hypothetical protein
LCEKTATSKKLDSKLLTTEKDEVVVAWVLTMQRVGLSIDEQ